MTNKFVDSIGKDRRASPVILTALQYVLLLKVVLASYAPHEPSGLRHLLYRIQPLFSLLKLLIHNDEIRLSS